MTTQLHQVHELQRAVENRGLPQRLAAQLLDEISAARDEIVSCGHMNRISLAMLAHRVEIVLRGDYPGVVQWT